MADGWLHSHAQFITARFSWHVYSRRLCPPNSDIFVRSKFNGRFQPFERQTSQLSLSWLHKLTGHHMIFGPEGTPYYAFGD